jgi:hypothetical protein
LELRSISADAADDLLSSRHILAGLLGAPIAHSASPAMHERAAEALGRARGGTNRCPRLAGPNQGADRMTARSIATVSLSGSLDEKLGAIAAAGFDAVEIFENDLLSFNGSPRDVGQLCRDLGLAICAFQPFRDFEGMPEPQRTRAFARAQRKFDLMQELGTDLLLICSNISPASVGGIDRAAADFRELGELSPRREACASASKRWPGGAMSTTIATPGKSCAVPTINRSGSFWTAFMRWRRRFRPMQFNRSRPTRFFWFSWQMRQG